eukprot:c8565_g1_i1 orf=163-312(+)
MSGCPSLKPPPLMVVALAISPLDPSTQEPYFQALECTTIPLVVTMHTFV